MTVQIAPPRTPVRLVHGDLLVAQSRVPFSLIVQGHLEGASAEEIQRERYPSLTLADVYAAIAYYLDRKVEMDAFLAARKKEGDRVEAETRAKSAPFVRLVLERARAKGLRAERP
jgi:uncharacterized protein (DUF433 family)